MVNKKLLSFTLLILLFFLLSLEALYCKNNEKKLIKESKTPVIAKKGDEKMDTTKWLSEDDGKYLLGVARETIKNRLDTIEEPQINWKEIPKKFQERLGTFVTPDFIL
jgi:hypothetical protein